MTAEDELLKVVNSSGFPLQIALQHAIEEKATAWRVRHKEHAWSSPNDGTSGFIDLVVQHRQSEDSLVVECKRVQHAAWLFIGHSGSTAERRHCKAWATHYKDAAMKLFGWVDLSVDPPTPEAQFCCLRGQSTNDKNTFLERVAAELVSSTEALALEERDYRSDSQESMRLYFNVVATTASLHFVEFDRTALSLGDGALPPVIRSV